MDMAPVSRSRGAYGRDLAVCFVVDRDKQESYRTIVPAVAMRRRGIKADVVPFQEMEHFRVFQWNVFVFHMLPGEEEFVKYLVSLLKKGGAKVVYDADDDPWGHIASQRCDPILIARLSDVNTVSTPALRKKIPNAVVLPNCLDFALWGKKKRKGPLTVGLSGGMSHLEDWRQIREPLETIQNRYGIRLLVGGYLPGYLRHLEVEFVPWVPYWEYPSTIREMDIILCPVTDDEFNLYKSGIKAVEAMSEGVVPVCSDHPIYRRVVNHQYSGLLVRGDWVEAISLLIEDEKQRSRLSFNGWKWARKHRDIDKWVGKWLKTYREAGVR